MKKSIFVVFGALLLFCVFGYVEVVTRAYTEVPQKDIIQPVQYTQLITCVGTSSPTIWRVDIERPNDPTKYKNPRISIFYRDFHTESYRLEDSYWKNRSIQGGVKAIFSASYGNIKVTLDANDFQHPTTAVLTINGQTVASFTSSGQATSGYYWTQSNNERTREGFTCPQSLAEDLTYGTCIDQIANPRFLP